MLQGRRSWKLIQSPDDDWVLHGMFLPWLSTDLTSECLSEEVRKQSGFSHQPDPVARDRFRSHIIRMERNSCVFGAECGIYLLNDNVPIGSSTLGTSNVEGVILGWGMCAEYENGWRVEHARILHLRLMPNVRYWDNLADIVHDLKRRYDVPVEMGWDPKDGETKASSEQDFIDYSWTNYYG